MQRSEVVDLLPVKCTGNVVKCIGQLSRVIFCENQRQVSGNVFLRLEVVRYVKIWQLSDFDFLGHETKGALE